MQILPYKKNIALLISTAIFGFAHIAKGPAMLILSFIAGWFLVIEFIFTLAMALECYPLQSGGLLAIEAMIIGMTTPDQVYHEILQYYNHQAVRTVYLYYDIVQV